MRYAPDSRQIRVPGSDADPLRNSLIRRGSPTPKGNQRQRGSLWIRRLKVRILPPQPIPDPSLLPSAWFVAGYRGLSWQECQVGGVLRVGDNKLAFESAVGSGASIAGRLQWRRLDEQPGPELPNSEPPVAGRPERLVKWVQ